MTFALVTYASDPPKVGVHVDKIADSTGRLTDL